MVDFSTARVGGFCGKQHQFYRKESNTGAFLGLRPLMQFHLKLMSCHRRLSSIFSRPEICSYKTAHGPQQKVICYLERRHRQNSAWSICEGYSPVFILLSTYSHLNSVLIVLRRFSHFLIG